LSTILVTGGAGYIGSHTCKALAKAGYIPITYDNLSTGHASAVKWGPLVQGDIADVETLGAALKKYKPIAVFHFAASALVIESIQNPAKYYQNNVIGTLRLLETLRAHAIKYIIFSSTCATYGIAKSTPMSEDHPQVPITPYGRTKWIAEQLINDSNLNSIHLRYFNAAGADLDGEIGETHTPETHLIPSVIQTALKLRDELVIYGDGSARRDYIHVDDLASAHILALQHLLKSNCSDVFNLGSGRGLSVREIIDAVQTFTGAKIPVRIEQKREGEPDILLADSQKAKRVLGWNPQHSDLETIITSAYNWHKK
jgi:UDP-glucose-4-epimerase GalE